VQPGAPSGNKGQSGTQPGPDGTKPGSKGQKVGPDGLAFTEKPGKGQGGEPGGGQAGGKPEEKPATGGSGNASGPGSNSGAPADPTARKSEGSGNAPGKPSDSPSKPQDVSRLFQPEQTKQPQTPGQAGAVGGAPRAGQVPGASNLDEGLDPGQRAAAQRLQQAVQRIQLRRDQRAPGVSPQREDPANQERRRDW
jgi:hypothetical protein